MKAKQQPTSKYGVTLVVAGSKLETVAKQIRKAVGDVKVLSIDRVSVSGEGEWGTEWVEHVGYMDTVLVNTDGRVIQRFQVEDEDGDYLGTYTYRTRDEYGQTLGDFDTVEEAKLAVREPMTQAEILDAADAVAAHVVRYGVGDRDDSNAIERAAESYLIGRGKELPEEFYEEEEGNRRTPEYLVTLRIKASTLPAVEKKAKAAFGDRLKGVKKVGRGFSRAAELAEAEELVEAAVEIVGELKGGLEEWKEGMPEQFQGGQKEEELDSAISELEDIENALDGVGWNVEFPGMF